MVNFQSPWSSSNNNAPTFTSPWSTPGALSTIKPTSDLTAADVNVPSIASQLNAGNTSNDSGGFFSNLWSKIMGAGSSALNFVGQKFNDFENATGLNHIAGALRGISNPQQYYTNTWQDDGSYLGGYKNIAGEIMTQLGNIGRSAYEGFTHPEETTQKFNSDLAQSTQNMDPVARIGLSFEAGAGTDPLTFLPVGSILGAAGKGVKAASDAVGATPYITSAVDAVKSTRPVQAITDALGKAFIKNYGTTDGLAQGLQDLQGALASDKMAIQQHLTQLAQEHGLSPDEIRQLPEVFEAKGSTNPKLQQAYQDLNNILNHGIPLQDDFKIGTNAETSTMFNGKPILDPEKLIEGYYPQRYSKELNPQLQQKMEELLQGSNKGFSTSGPFGQERQFKTVAEAEANGFNPERNAYAAIAQRLAESSKALRTAQFLQNMVDRGIFSKEALPGMKASDIKPLSSYFTIVEKKPIGSSPLSQSLNESGAAFKPLTKIDDTGFKLPSDLSKSAPRYRSNPLSFESDLDKAAYIIGNTTNRSARDADFVAALSKHTGLTEPELRAYGQYMRSAVKNAANGAADGEKITIPRTLSNLPEHGTNPLSAEPGAVGDTNDFASLVKSLEEASPADKIVKVNPYYIKPADEAAIQEYLSPSNPTGILGAINKLNNLYNKGFLLNPLPHMHNITTNGIVLGEANPSYIREAFSNIKNGVSDPWYEQAVRAGAISNLRGGNLMQSVNEAIAPEKGLAGKLLDKLNYARHDALWDTDSAIRTALFRQAKEAGMTDADAAAQVNKFMVNYDNLTPFEKKYIKPVIPFYSWKKGNIPLQISQTFAQTPKYVAYEHAKDAISQGISGEPTDQKGRIMTGIKLPDGSEVAIDPYSPMDEPGKILEKGPVSWLLGSLNPFIREAEAQGSSALGAFAPGLGIQNKFPIYNAGAPADYNIRKGIVHAINALNPFGSSAIIGEIGSMPNFISNMAGLPTKDKPDQTTAELVTKLLGGFSGRDNPTKDAINQQYQQKDNILGQIKYLRETGQPVPKSLQKQAYRRIPKAN